MPFSRAITYKLMDAGLISSVVVTWPGSSRDRRLIDGDVWLVLERITQNSFAGSQREGSPHAMDVVKRGFKGVGPWATQWVRRDTPVEGLLLGRDRRLTPTAGPTGCIRMNGNTRKECGIRTG